MLVKIEGKITRKDPTYIELKTGGLTYGIFISLFTSSKLAKDDEIELLLTQLLKEDSNKLYGFLSQKEQFVFNSLIKISGVGATTAMAVCSAYEPDAFFATLHKGDPKALTVVPGIGLKGAKRILAELGDSSFTFEEGGDFSKAKAALLSLGFKDEKVTKALRDAKGPLEDLIKQALKKLS